MHKTVVWANDGDPKLGMEMLIIKTDINILKNEGIYGYKDI